MNKWQQKDFHYTCKVCGKKISMLYLIQMADRKKSPHLKCICGEHIGEVCG